MLLPLWFIQHSLNHTSVSVPEQCDWFVCSNLSSLDKNMSSCESWMINTEQEARRYSVSGNLMDHHLESGRYVTICISGLPTSRLSGISEYDWISDHEIRYNYPLLVVTKDMVKDVGFPLRSKIVSKE